jgi:hypothetical protein
VPLFVISILNNVYRFLFFFCFFFSTQQHKDLNRAFKEMELLNENLMEKGYIIEPLKSVPYPFQGYDDLPGNRALLSSSSSSGYLKSNYLNLRDNGLGHVVLVGGGSGGTLNNLAN